MKKYIRAAIKDISEEDNQYQFYLASAPDTSPRTLEQLFALNDGNINVNLAKNKNLPSDLAIKLAQWNGPEDLLVLSWLARNPSVNAEVLDTIIDNPNRTDVISYYIACNPNLSVRAQYELADSDDPDVRYGLAENPNLAEEVMYILADDSSKDVRNEVASKDNVPEDLLRKFAEDDEPFVRIAVAFHERTPVDVLVKLVDDPDEIVRYYLARNDNTPTDILQYLCNSEHRATREHARKTLERKGIHVDTEADE